MTISVVYMTAKDEAEAASIGKALVEERLVACVNILGAIRSIYWWDGKVNDEGEVAMTAKTRSELVDRVIARVRSFHSYECPCVIAVPIESGFEPYLDWVRQQTANG